MSMFIGCLLMQGPFQLLAADAGWPAWKRFLGAFCMSFGAFCISMWSAYRATERKSSE